MMKKVVFIFGLYAASSCQAMDQQIQIKTVTSADFEANRRARIPQIQKEREQEILSMIKRPDVFEREQLLESVKLFKGTALFDPFNEDSESD